MKTLKTVLFFIAFPIILVVLSSCNDDDDRVPPPYTGLEGHRIIIHNIQYLPEDIEIEYLSAEIKGKSWSIISTVKGYPEGDYFVMELPANFDSDMLAPSQWKIKETGSGFWPAESSDPMAGVAGLGDILAYSGSEVVGSVVLSDWPGKGSSLNSTFIHYHYAEKAFSLSGNNLNVYGSKTFKASYRYSISFEPGWNVYATINPSSSGGLMHQTTDIPENLNLQWRFDKR